MNTTDLRSLITQCVDGGTGPISVSEIKARAALREAAARPVPVRRRARLVIAAGGLAAAGIAGALVASQIGGVNARTPAVLTAAMLKHVADASWAAMTSGQADIDWTSSRSSASVIQDITFDGANWNDVMNPGEPEQVRHSGNMTSWTGENINRVVGGQLYHYPAVARTPQPHLVQGWMHITAPGAAAPLTIPDPRSLLSVLSPSAAFISDGYTTVNGVTLQHLHATTPGAAPVTPWDQIIGSEPDNPVVSGIDVWVSSSDVVVKAQVTVTGSGTGSVTVTVMFSRIGQPQAITVPSPIVSTLGGKG